MPKSTTLLTIELPQMFPIGTNRNSKLLPPNNHTPNARLFSQFLLMGEVFVHAFNTLTSNA